MRLTATQLDNILGQISKNILLYIGFNLGEAALSLADIALLKSFGVKYAGIGGEFPAYLRMYMLGRLTQLLGDEQSKLLSYADFEAYLLRRQFQPLTAFEQAQYEIARAATYHHLKNLDHRVRSDAEGSINGYLSRAAYEGVFNEELAAGVSERKAVTTIISDIGHRTGDWSKDLGRIVDTEMNNIFQQGRVTQMLRDNPGKDPLVYKDVYEGACRHCIALYLTNGLGSAPRLFRLSELVTNGSNVGRKVEDWLPTVNGIHPWCRCILRSVEPYTKWDKAKKQFVFNETVISAEERRLNVRGKVKVYVGDKVYEA